MKTPKRTKKLARSQQSGMPALSRRDFIAAAASTGLALGAGQAAAATPASLQGTVPPKPENELPKDQPEIYRGTAAGAVLAQLKAAGVRTLFHTNTSGFVPF